MIAQGRRSLSPEGTKKAFEEIIVSFSFSASTLQTLLAELVPLRSKAAVDLLIRDKIASRGLKMLSFLVEIYELLLSLSLYNGWTRFKNK